MIVYSLLAAVITPPALAQTYPTKPIRAIVPFPAGGGIDTVIRLLGPKISETLGQPLLIDNRSGASGTLGTEIVAKAPADGYTLLGTFSSHPQNQILYKNLPFDTLRDFAPIRLSAPSPTSSSSIRAPGENGKELVALAKKRPARSSTPRSGPRRRRT